MSKRAIKLTVKVSLKHLLRTGRRSPASGAGAHRDRRRVARSTSKVQFKREGER